MLYVLDEPTIGLHPRDNGRLLKALRRLRDLGNTLVLVEHDREVIEAADHLVDFGPGAGEDGGRITAAGAPSVVKKSRDSLTGSYLSGKAAIPLPTDRRLASPEANVPAIIVRGARQHNLRNLDVRFPLGVFTTVTGVSGSGKSSLVEDILWKAAARTLHRAQLSPGAHASIEGFELINKVISVDQTPIGNTPSSTPATYTGAFDLIRELFAKLPAAKVRGYSARRFSFNQAGGRCEACEGAGQKRIEMHFLPDVWITCDACGGSRYTPETLAVTFHGRTIADVLAMSVAAALDLFANVPRVRRILQTLTDVGLGYVSLGQAAPTLSGGESQRVKLAAELSRPNTGKTLYILDEPTTGLHFDDVRKLLEVIHRLTDFGNTVVVIEHNLEVIKTADWVIELGPDAGTAGGSLVAEGTPEQVAETAGSHTGKFLKPVLAAGPRAERSAFTSATVPVPTRARSAAPVIGLPGRHGDANGEAVPGTPASAKRRSKLDATAERDAKAPWELDGRQWHTRDRIARNGQPPRWDGRILELIVDEVESLCAQAVKGTDDVLAGVAPTDWSQRNLVRIDGLDPTRIKLPFFHATTSSEWVVTLRFFVPRNTFTQVRLERQLALVAFDEYETPVLCDQPRLKIESLGPFQQITIVGHSVEEFETSGFSAFLNAAVTAYIRGGKPGTIKRGSDVS